MDDAGKGIFPKNLGAQMEKWWVSLCIRGIDYGLLFFLGGLVFLSLPCYLDTYVYVLFAVVTPLLWVPIEALLVSSWGTTVGNWFLGYRIRDGQGAKLGFVAALKQALGLGVSTRVMQGLPRPFFRTCTAFLTAICCFLGGAFAMKVADFTLGIERSLSTEGWVQYSSEEKGFTVAFPTDPKLEENKTLEIPNQSKTLNYSEVISETRKAQYSVSYMELPKRWRLAGSTTLLKGSLEAIVKHLPETMLIEKEFTTHRDERALDFHLKQGEDEVRGRLLIVGGTLYKLTVVYPPSIASDLQHRTFLDSFEVSH